MVTLLSGGAMGAIIKILYDVRQNKAQTIGKRLNVFPLFRQVGKQESFSATVAVTVGGSTTEYKNLFIADLTVVNRGNKDHENFEMGVALGNDECVYAAWENPDQHHTLILATPISPSTPTPNIKFNLAPFNRSDSYSLRLYVTSGDVSRKPNNIKITSRHRAKFVDESSRLTSGETWMRTAVVAAITVFMAVAANLFITKVGYYYGSHAALQDARIERIAFSPKIPFPLDFDKIFPGSHLSDVRAAYPSGKLEMNAYTSDIATGPFSMIIVIFPSGENDPLVSEVSFVIRNQASMRYAKDATLTKFASFPHHSEALGSRIVWPNIEGFSLTLSEKQYAITKAIPHEHLTN